MDNDWNTADQSIDAAVHERNSALRLQRRYYDSLHYVDLSTVNADAYYDSLKDRSKFKEPRDTSRRNAEKKSGISGFLKFKALFSEKSKNELDNKKETAAPLQKEYSKSFSECVQREREQFYQRQEDSNNAVNLMRQKLIQHDRAEVLEYFRDVLLVDDFTLDKLATNERYKSFVAVTDYDPKSSELSYCLRIPNQEEICVIDSFFYDEKEEIISSRDVNKTRARNIRLRIVRAMLLRSAAMVYLSDDYENVKSVNITGYLNYYDSAFGNEQRIDAVKVKISKDTFEQLNPEHLKLEDLFVRVLKVKEAAGLYNKEPFELNEIK